MTTPPDLVEPQFQPQGARRLEDGSVQWRIWAPYCESVELVLFDPKGMRTIQLTPDAWGYCTHQQSDVADGMRYAYRLPQQMEIPDPASRWQPDGVHQPSAVYTPGKFEWNDHAWRGVPLNELVVYELHVGTFTQNGTFDGVRERLKDLKQLGITAIELMPISQFPGHRNWGYDGVQPYAAQNSYGGPEAFQRLVDAAHAEGMAVLLDVVYNHLGPEGNYLGLLGPYFTDHYGTPWGQAINYDGRDCEPVRRYVIDNVLMWADEYHLDGLRLDAVHAIFDMGARHLLQELQTEVQQVAQRQDRAIHIIAESDQNDVRLLNPPEQGGYGLDASWSDDFHHIVHTLLTGEQDGYYSAFRTGDQLAKVFNDGFVYDGGFSPYRRRRHGTPAGDLDRSRLIVCVQNHDQIGNRACGERFGVLLPPSAQRMAAALMLLSPFTPMLYMGEEYGEQRPFPFFCSFGDAELIEAVRRGRRAEFAGLDFQWQQEIPDPQAESTFESAKLTWSWPQGSTAAGIRQLYRDLIAMRRTPALADQQHTAARWIPSSATANDLPLGQTDRGVLVLERGAGAALVAWFNVSGEQTPLPETPPAGRSLLASTESERYGGTRTAGEVPDALEPYEVLIWGQST